VAAPETRFYDSASPEAPAPNRPRSLSVYALIERDRELLLELRADAPVWSLIAGRVEDDESILDGVRREVAEETGLTVIRCELFGHFSDPARVVSYPDGNVYAVVTLAYYVTVESFDGLRPSSESRELRFFSKEALADLDIPATQRSVLDHYISGRPGPHLEYRPCPVPGTPGIQSAPVSA
jgi:8-oxo-dGTP pyrophosphatase MutT (NUDIX family)